jgi:hypothetical protein
MGQGLFEREEIRINRLLEIATASTRWTLWSGIIIGARKLGPAAWQIFPDTSVEWSPSKRIV